MSFVLNAQKNITKNDFIELLHNLEQEFNSFYDSAEYSFSPSAEHGIVFNNFNDRDNYKSLNIWFIDSSDNFIKNVFNEVNENFKNEWKNNEDILIKKNQYIRTKQQRKYHAQKWSKKEFAIFYNAFAKSGLIMSQLGIWTYTKLSNM